MAADTTKETEGSGLIALAYVILIGANVAFTLYELRGSELHATLAHHLDRLTEPVRKRPWLNPKKWRRLTSEVIVEAWQASEGQFEPKENDGPG